MAMWPELFGTGSELGLFVAATVMAAFGGFVWFAMRSARPLGPDPVADLWARYEHGDLTSWEAARLFRIVEGQQAAAQRAERRNSLIAGRTETEGAGRRLSLSWAAEPVEPGSADYRVRAR
jgi:hypothetical protein